ncbi:helix-turn-helix domain-containing protein [Microbacterium excoecariae]|uniref:helix-turn-helix domain-containing protein n=1 Tax=Microbacterium excoecariae TaxID=2715210 RepID=UPI003B82E1E3
MRAWLRAIREERGLSLQELSERSGVGIATLRHMESGERGDWADGLRAWHRVGGALGYDAAEWFGPLDD